MNFSLIDFSFIPFLDFTSDNEYMSVFTSIQEDSYLYSIGLESGSCIPNLVSMGMMFLVIPLVHLLLALLYQYTKSYKHKKLFCCYPIKWLAKLFWAFTFGVYIRWIMEVYLLMIIAVFSEFREFKHFGFYESISAGVGVLIIGFSIVFTLLMIRKTIELLEHRDMSQLKYLSEFFAGIKNKSIPLFYTTAFMFRRTIL